MELTGKRVILVPLSVIDAAAFTAIYVNEKVLERLEAVPVNVSETPAAFTRRIKAACNFIWTIRLKNQPGIIIIGDCAFHHWDKQTKSLEIGGTLLPEFWQKGLMQEAFLLLINFAKTELDAKVIIGKTRSSNLYAIKLAENLGFCKVAEFADETVLELQVG